MRERDIEEAVCKYARKRYGAMALKFTSPQRRNVPDRIFIFPGGVIGFLEFKAPGKAPSEGQFREIRRIQDRGHYVAWTGDVDEGIRIIDNWVMGVLR